MEQVHSAGSALLDFFVVQLKKVEKVANAMKKDYINRWVVRELFHSNVYSPRTQAAEPNHF